MEPFAADALDLITTSHDSLRAAIQKADTRALNWQPAPETNSIYVLATHVLASERYWLAQVVGEEAHRDRAAEFAAAGADPNDLYHLIDQADVDAKAYLSRFSPQDADRQLPFQNRQVSGVWGVLHVIEHLREHIAHAELTLQLWAQGKSAI